MKVYHSLNPQANFLCTGVIVIFIFFLLLPLPGQESDKTINLQQWQFLLGDWVGEGGGSPGQGSGYFSFRPAVQNTVLIRSNHSDFPATADRPAFAHDDLMIIYYESDTLQAMYFDNEKHVIHYLIEFAGDSSAVTFLSDVVAGAPRFRLTYSKLTGDAVKLSFDFAPPGKPDDFSKYIEATAGRKK